MEFKKGQKMCSFSLYIIWYISFIFMCNCPTNIPLIHPPKYILYDDESVSISLYVYTKVYICLT